MLWGALDWCSSCRFINWLIVRTPRDPLFICLYWAIRRKLGDDYYGNLFPIARTGSTHHTGLNWVFVCYLQCLANHIIGRTNASYVPVVQATVVLLNIDPATKCLYSTPNVITCVSILTYMLCHILKRIWNNITLHWIKQKQKTTEVETHWFQNLHCFQAFEAPCLPFEEKKVN